MIVLGWLKPPQTSSKNRRNRTTITAHFEEV